MQPIISIVGRSESGKTTLLESLIAEIKRRGYRVAVIKHSAENVEVDAVNKDTWRFSRAGATVSAISSGNNLGIFRRLAEDPGPEELAQLAPDCDLVLTEGFKHSRYPKIEVHRKVQGSDLVSPPEQLLGVVTDEPLEVSVPQFSREDVRQIADLVEQTVIARQKEGTADLFINGAAVPAKPMFRDVLSRTLLSMVTLFQDVRNTRTVSVFWRRKRA